MHPIEKLSTLVDRYNEKKDSFDIEELQDIRDDISNNLYLSADFMSDTRVGSEAAQYNYKKCCAEYAEDLEGKINSKTNKKYTRETIKSKTIIHCSKSYDEVLEANRKYYKVKIVEDSIKQILNSISSRINNIK